ncbi:MAG: hypothetical protein KJO34_16915 [Deltaproteobacteria bacterium]|nr:hypothetical protein [Deltaproteobacteria bacterium]
MLDFTEKRSSERIYIKAPIKYFHSDNKYAFNANIFNCSDNGIYFETGYPLKPGIDVIVSGAENKKDFRINIKWCKRVGPEDKSIFGIGAQYCE